MFLIQTRKIENIRAVDIFNSAGDARDWTNYDHQFDDIEKAKGECASLIKSGIHKAEDVRILKVACTFNAEIEVLANEE